MTVLSFPLEASSPTINPAMPSHFCTSFQSLQGWCLHHDYSLCSKLFQALTDSLSVCTALSYIHTLSGNKGKTHIIMILFKRFDFFPVTMSNRIPCLPCQTQVSNFVDDGGLLQQQIRSSF